MGRYARFAMPLATLLLLAALWEYAVHAFDIPTFVLAPPSAIIDAAVENASPLVGHLRITLFEALAGFLLAVAVSLPLALAIVYSRLLRDAVYPLIVLTQAMPLATLLLLAALWEYAVHAFAIPTFVLAPPSAIIDAAVENASALVGHLRITLFEALAGFLLAVAVSLPLALAIVYSRLLRDAVYPLIVLTQAMPMVAVAPVLLLALGYGRLTKVVVAFLVCFFPIVINSAAGLGNVPAERLELGRSISASEFDVLRKIRLPTALPAIFVGLRLGITLAVIGAVIGEFVGADEGLGYFIVISMANARTALSFASIITLGLVSIALFYMIVWLERLTIPWAHR